MSVSTICYRQTSTFEWIPLWVLISCSTNIDQNGWNKCHVTLRFTSVRMSSSFSNWLSNWPDFDLPGVVYWIKSNNSFSSIPDLFCLFYIKRCIWNKSGQISSSTTDQVARVNRISSNRPQHQHRSFADNTCLLSWIRIQTRCLVLLQDSLLNIFRAILNVSRHPQRESNNNVAYWKIVYWTRE